MTSGLQRREVREWFIHYLSIFDDVEHLNAFDGGHLMHKCETREGYL